MGAAELSKVACRWGDRIRVQTDLSRLVFWAKTNKRKFSSEYC